MITMFGPTESCWRVRIPVALMAALCLGIVGCERPDSPPRRDSDPPSSPAASRGGDATRVEPEEAPVRPGSIEIVFPYGSEKDKWVKAVTEPFNSAGHKTSTGKPIFVRVVPIGSGELKDEILAGRLRAHLASPASAAFIELGNAESITQTGGPLIGDTQNLVLSPVIIAMWKPMAEALGWPDKPLGWADIIEMANDTEGWAKYEYPQWGQFKFGHTHPQYSNSGLISLIAEVYAGAEKTRGLSLDDVARPETGEFLREIERSVVHYGSSTGFFGRKMFANGPSYLSAAVLYENMVIESYSKPKGELPFPVVAIYPKEGTFWSDHPVGIVERDWVTDEHREAAEKYIEYLTATPQQERAMEFGFRPADVNVSLGSPIDKQHGIDPEQPATTLEVPRAEVMEAIIELWKKNKKHANVVLVIDVSGSMRGEKMAGAKAGAAELVNVLGDEDLLSLLPFNNEVRFAGQGLSMGSDRQKARATVGSYFADGGTALYDAVAAADRYFDEKPTPEMITAIVVLSDGEDTNSAMQLGDLLRQISSGSESKATRIFTIGYGDGALEDILTEIAESTKAKFYHGSPENIREVFKEISTFF